MGGSVEIKLRVDGLSLYLPDRHRSPIRGPHTGEPRAIPELGKSLADHPYVRLVAAMSEAGALTRWLIEEQPDGCRSSDCDQ